MEYFHFFFIISSIFQNIKTLIQFLTLFKTSRKSNQLNFLQLQIFLLSLSLWKCTICLPQFGVPGGFGPPGGFLWRPSFQTLQKPVSDYNNNYYPPLPGQYPFDSSTDSNYEVTDDPEEELKKYNYNKYNPYSSYNKNKYNRKQPQYG